MALTPAPPTLLAEFRDPNGDDLRGFVPVIGWDDEGVPWVQPMGVPEHAGPVDCYAENHALEYLGLVAMGANARHHRGPLGNDDAQR